MKTMKGPHGIVTAAPSWTTRHSIAVSSVRCPGTPEFGRICTWMRARLRAPSRRKGNRGNFHLPSLFISDCMGGVGMTLQPLIRTKGNMGRVPRPFSTHYRVRDRKGYLKQRKDSLLKECTQTIQELFCGIPVVQVTAAWPLFYKIELWIRVWHVTVYATNCEFPEQTALWKTKAPRASSRRFLLKRRTGKSTQKRMGRAGGWGWGVE